MPFWKKNIYRTRAIITRSWFETALNYKPRILDSNNEELPFFSTKAVCNSNLSTIYTAVKNGVKEIQTAGYNGVRMVDNTLTLLG